MGLLDFMNFNGGILGRQSPYTDEMRQRAGMQSLGLLGGTMMAAGAPSTDPGQYGRIMAQGLSQAGPQMQASLDRELAMADYQKQQEMRDQLPGILTEAGVPENMVGLLSMNPDAAIDYLTREQPERRIVQGADGYNYYADTMERVLPGVEQPVDPFTPDLQTLTRGDQTESGYFDQNGNWVSMGSGPRWQGETPDGPDYQNFYIPGEGQRAFDLNSDEGRAAAAAAVNNGGYRISTSLQATTEGDLSGDVMEGPRDAAGKVIKPEDGYQWMRDETAPGGWRQELIAGTPQAQEAETEVQQAEQARTRVLQGADRVIATVDEAIGMIDDQGLFSPVTGQGGQIAEMIGSPARAQLDGALTTIKAILGFEELQAMRAASPTGGALGQVAVQELNALQSTIANLNPDMGEDALRANLNKIREHYSNVIDAIRQSQGSGNVIDFNDLPE